MAGALFWLSDGAWAAIEPHLPRNQPEARRVDDRRVISGIVQMLKCGGWWQDCPGEYGPSTTVYDRWNRRGVWGRILTALTDESWIAETAQINSSYAKTHRCSGGPKGGSGPSHRRSGPGEWASPSGGNCKSAVTVARKLAVMLHRMWSDQTEFRRGKEPAGRVTA